MGFSPNQNFWECGCTPASYSSAFAHLFRNACEKDSIGADDIGVK